ncbi:MAG: flagellar motor switch protein FliG, partial [Oscillospiraceae bacterium]|nr:flagellar motor switch protein FliG [Oscillospiraceae bacterium]
MPTDIALSPQEKAAVLMISLGVEYSSALYKNMSEEDITELTLSITMIKRIDKETRDTVIEEFYRLCRSQQYISDGGLDYARDILSQVFGTDAADKIINQLSSELAVKPFDFVRKVSADQILNVIHGEHPQTIALVLSFMKPKQAAEIVAALEPDLQADIIARIAGMGTTSPEF